MLAVDVLAVGVLDVDVLFVVKMVLDVLMVVVVVVVVSFDDFVAPDELVVAFVIDVIGV